MGSLATFFIQFDFCWCDKSHGTQLHRRKKWVISAHRLHLIIHGTQGRTQLKSRAAGETETMVECCFLLPSLWLGISQQSDTPLQERHIQGALASPSGLDSSTLVSIHDNASQTCPWVNEVQSYTHLRHHYIVYLCEGYQKQNRA